jgi:hypothetical protein
MFSKVLMLDAVSKAATASSLGDKYVLQIHYPHQYQELPLTVDYAKSVGWEVSEDCVPGLGRRAEPDGSYLDFGRDSALHLWYDQTGNVTGFGFSAVSGIAAPWKQVGDHFEIDFLTRDPEAACGDGPAPEKGSIGDRLLMVGNEGNVTTIPTTLKGAFNENYNDGGPCFPRMGWHMMLDRFEVSTPTPVYNGGDGSLLAMNLNSYAEQQTPSSEYPAPKEGKAVYGWHVYFKEHDNACDGGKTAYAFPFAETPEATAYTDFHCTPYFGNLWVQTLATVVDLQATGSACQDAGIEGDCKFVHYVGPNPHFGGGTLCVPPAPEEGCHCYHQLTYDGGCEKQISTSNASGTWDTSDAFDENGVLRGCSDNVVNNVVVGWAPPAEKPTPCDCEGIVQV